MKNASSNVRFFRRDNAAPLGTGARPLPGSLATSRTGAPAGPAHLTPRQLEVLALLCEGLPNKLICRRLNIATGTVKVHISCILKEFGVTSRLQVVVAAQSCGLYAGTAGESPGNPGASRCVDAAGVRNRTAAA